MYENLQFLFVTWSYYKYCILAHYFKLMWDVFFFPLHIQNSIKGYNLQKKINFGILK